MILAEDDLKKKEEKLAVEKKEMSDYRNKNEKKYAKNAVKQKLASQR